jgi:sigma-B regulation protein RsbU (phosphoserine phosphatase)
LTAKIQGLLGAGADTGTPAEIMQTVNRGLTRRAIESRYATIFSAMLTPGGLLTFCNAGHNPPLLFDGGRVRRLESGSMPVGMFDFAQYTDASEQLTTGNVLVVYSDGVTEALNVEGQEFGEDRLAALLEQRYADDASVILEAIVAEVQAFARGAAQHDDVTAMVVKFNG